MSDGAVCWDCTKSRHSLCTGVDDAPPVGTGGSCTCTHEDDEEEMSDTGSAPLEEDLAKKLAVEHKYVAVCRMNQCARGGPGLIIALEDSEGIAAQTAEAHRNAHRDHERQTQAILAKHRSTVVTANQVEEA